VTLISRLDRAQSQEGRMSDQAIVINALDQAGLIISEYLEPGPRDPVATMDRLIGVLAAKTSRRRLGG
jgi:hypothetical protein